MIAIIVVASFLICVFAVVIMVCAVVVWVLVTDLVSRDTVALWGSGTLDIERTGPHESSSELICSRSPKLTHKHWIDRQ